jgi:branched-subunit amino acid ABC-type transport system permease component
MVAALSIFFRYTRIGLGFRAVCTAFVWLLRCRR